MKSLSGTEIKANILVVDDEPQITRVLKTSLSSQGYGIRTAADGEEALQMMRDWAPDLIVTDLRMPNMDGLELCRRVRTESRIPIIVLSVKGEETIKVGALDAGADDYVTKPFSPRELLARVHSVRRRLLGPKEHDQYAFANIAIDFSRMILTRDHKEVAVTPQEFKILKYFVNNIERVISREELLNQVWGFNSYPSTRTVDNHLVKLRQKVEKDPENPSHFKTVHGAGYKFVP